jgi:hypothetical protein
VLIVVVLGLGGGIFVGGLRRIDAMTGTTQRIMAGDLSGRLPVGQRRRDRPAAENLNAMLERIEALMAASRKSPTTSLTISRRR